ncbi:hypothetical protein [Aromatoleum bremense]|uniref:Uncharacterized protein n=1 Tax=Aromatoleum bremense TaxID=76115 RepID=A0ABX1NRN5_9RHOO|nr:hypothetical protein [Aromatoleum bremense]NMG14222.1 hypothetical protein [Aromatoleum bremense]QTQ34003.1 Uncharacterized protein pbN1_40200 [Aromatoleum bremense]
MRIAREVMAQWQSTAESTPLTVGLIPPRDYTGISTQDAQLRIWLPDPARQALSEICERMGVSMTVYLTEFFATYLFGIHELIRMQDAQEGLYKPQPVPRGSAMTVVGDVGESDEPGPEFDEPVPEMGKNIFALKLFLPAKIKDGLQRRADHAQVPLGRFTRAMICAHLFGRDMGARRIMEWEGA